MARYWPRSFRRIGVERAYPGYSSGVPVGKKKRARYGGGTIYLGGNYAPLFTEPEREQKRKEDDLRLGVGDVLGFVPDAWWGWGAASTYAIAIGETDDKVKMRKNARRATVLIKLARRLKP